MVNTPLVRPAISRGGRLTSHENGNIVSEKLMVGRRSFPFGARSSLLYAGDLLNYQTGPIFHSGGGFQTELACWGCMKPFPIGSM